MKPKYIVIIILAVIAAGTSAYALSRPIHVDSIVASQKAKNQSSSAMWKICQNSALGFQFEFPSDWLITAWSDSQGAADRPPQFIDSCEKVAFGLSLIARDGEKVGMASVDVCDLNCMKTSVYKNIRDVNEYASAVYPGKNIQRGMLGGQESLLLNGQTIVVYNGMLYTIFLNPIVNKRVSDHFMQTFKFLPPPADLSGWKTLKNDEFGYLFSYEWDGTNSYHEVYVDSTTSMVTFDAVAETPPAIYLYRDPGKFHSQSFNPNSASFDDLTYSPTTRQWIVKLWDPNSGSDKVSCPTEMFDVGQKIPYYQIETGFHAGSYIDAYITGKGLVVWAGKSFEKGNMSFTNPSTVMKAMCVVEK